MNNTNSRKKIIFCVILLIFGIIYCQISLINHYLFRTYSLDLGMFNHAIYDFSHFRMNYFTLDVQADEINYFADHFSPITVLLSPFYYLFGSYTLLIIQIASIIFGGIGIYKFASEHFKNSYLPLIFLIHFFSIWGIYSALSYEFHTNVLAAMFVPWLIYYYQKNNITAFVIFFILILISKENMPLWLIFIVLGLLFEKTKDNHQNFGLKNALKFEIPLIILTLAYFIIVVGIVMPLLNTKGESGTISNQILRYGHLGNSLSEILTNIIMHPINTFQLFFESTLSEPLTHGIKSELHFMFLVAGGFTVFYCPQYLIMLIPIYAQKFLTLEPVIWGINSQYSIELVPLISLALISFVSKIKSIKRSYFLVFMITIFTITSNYSTIETRKSIWYNSQNTIFYAKYHYETTLDVAKIREALKLVPDDAIISVSSTLGPHLAFRKKIYHFPVVKDAEYIVATTSENTAFYPLSGEEYFRLIDEYKHSKSYSIEYEMNDLIILKKTNNN